MSFPTAPFTFGVPDSQGRGAGAAPPGGAFVAPAFGGGFHFGPPLGAPDHAALPLPPPLAHAPAPVPPSERAKARQRDSDLLDHRSSHNQSAREEDELSTQEIIREQMRAAEKKKKQLEAAAAPDAAPNAAEQSASSASPSAGSAASPSKAGSGHKLIRARRRPPPEPVFTPLNWSHTDEWVSDRVTWEAFSPLWVGRTMYDSVLAMILARTDVAQDVAHLIVQYAEPPYRAVMIRPVGLRQDLPAIPPTARTIAVAMSLTSDRVSSGSHDPNYASVVWREREAGQADDARPESPTRNFFGPIEKRKATSHVQIQSEMFPVAEVEKQLAELSVSSNEAATSPAAAPAATVAASSSSPVPAPSPSTDEDDTEDADAGSPEPRELRWHNWKLTAWPGCRDERLQQLEPSWGPLSRFAFDPKGLISAFAFYTMPREK